MDTAAQLVADQILATLAAKHGRTESEIVAGLAAGDPVLGAQVLELAEVGRQVAIRTAFAG